MTTVLLIRDKMTFLKKHIWTRVIVRKGYTIYMLVLNTYSLKLILKQYLKCCDKTINEFINNIFLFGCFNSNIRLTYIVAADSN